MIASRSGIAAEATPAPRPWTLRRFVRFVGVLSSFAWFWSGAVLLGWLVLPWVALFAKDGRRACQRVVSASFRLFHGYMRVLGLFDAELLRPAPALDRPVVLVANHTTLVDVTAILSQVPNVCCLAKTVYARNPLVGRLLSYAGFIDAGSTLEERAASVKTALQRIEEGYHVLVFPEGSRSPLGGMSRFKRGAFEIACQAKVPVVPLVLRCAPSALRRDQRVWEQPDTVARLSIEADEAIDPARFPQGSRRMRDAVEAHFRARLGIGSPTERIPSSEPTSHGT